MNGYQISVGPLTATSDGTRFSAQAFTNDSALSALERLAGQSAVMFWAGHAYPGFFWFYVTPNGSGADPIWDRNHASAIVMPNVVPEGGTPIWLRPLEQGESKHLKDVFLVVLQGCYTGEPAAGSDAAAKGLTESTAGWLIESGADFVVGTNTYANILPRQVNQNATKFLDLLNVGKTIEDAFKDAFPVQGRSMSDTSGELETYHLYAAPLIRPSERLRPARHGHARN